MNYLNDIIASKKNEIAEAKRQLPLRQIQKELSTKQLAHRSLKQSLLKYQPAIIAEIKRKSPSRGQLRTIENAAALAQEYAGAGAAAISVLTDSKYFGGSFEDLMMIREHINIPILRKDFIIDPYQVYESKYYGADALLLITSCLEMTQLSGLYSLAYDIGVEVLLEVESEDDIKKINMLQIDIIGINNRNLHTFDESINTSFKLFSYLPSRSIKVSESCLTNISQIIDLYNIGYRGFLIGETFMCADRPGELLQAFIEEFKRKKLHENSH